MGATKTQVISAENTPKADKPETVSARKEKKTKIHGKKYLAAKVKIDRNRLYNLKDAVALVKETASTKFDSTVELHMVVRKEGLSVNVELPHSSGKSKKVEVADEATLEKLKTGKVDFDVLLATADMMPKLVPFARILGPKGLMPNPKNGTIIKSAKDKDKFNADKLAIKTEKKAPVIHTIAGKTSMKDGDLAENIDVILNAVTKRQIVKAYLASTMGPSVKLSID